MDPELSRFKHDINLLEYANSFGYEIDRRESSRGSIILRGPNDDKLIVSLRDGKWIYFSSRDESDNGTIIDFHQRQTGDQLGKTRMALRTHLGASGSAFSFEATCFPTTPKRSLSEELLRMTPLPHHPWLSQTRAIGKEILSSARFVKRVWSDSRNNVVFPQYGPDSTLCGFERRNAHFKGFSPGSKRGLWMSNHSQEDHTLLVCESAIDCLSHFALYHPPRVAYAATGGALSELQINMICEAGTVFQDVVISFDADPAGRNFDSRVTKRLCALCIDFSISKPPGPAKDWNELLRPS